MRLITLLFAAIWLTACHHSSHHQRVANIAKLIDSEQWTPLLFKVSGIPLRAYYPQPLQPTTRLFIYIEGDGKAWKSRRLPSDNLTPDNPLGLKLALAHPDDNAVYLGRPCQIAFHPPTCDPSLWLEGRFSAKVVHLSNQAIDSLKQHFQAKELVLVGYSGGGAVAALVAATRDDIAGLISVAGNLDHTTWTQHHGVTALHHSLNPIDYASQLNAIKQFHFYGNDDTIVPPSIAQAFQAHFSTPVIYPIPSNDHTCCWEKQWPGLIHQTHLLLTIDK